MSVFDFLRPSRPQEHPALGLLHYARGRWRGTIELERGERITLFVPGGRGGPLEEGLQLAQRAPERWLRVRPAVEKELYDHYDAGRDAGLSDLPNITTPGEVWAHVTLSSVEIKPFRSLGEFQVALRTAWDDEHTLGALVRDVTLVGVNGSIVDPR
jgi:hypothetical protein